MPQNKSLTKQQTAAFSTFLEYADTSRLNRNLRNMLLLYLMYEDDVIPNDLPDLLYDLYNLFALLDEVGE